MIVALLAGVLVGISLGALGGGGAIVTVPVLVYAIGQSPLEATTGSLIIVGLSALIAAITYARRGLVRWSHAVMFGVLGIAGTVAGSWASSRIDERLLMVGFGVLLLLVAILMWRKATRGSAPQPDEPEMLVSLWGCSWQQQAKVWAAAIGVGLVTGFFGVGGGFAIVPALVLVLGMPMPVAVATSLLIISFNSATALASRLGGGIDLDWPIIAAFTAAAIAGSFAGTKVAARFKPTDLQKAFAILLVVTSVYTLIRTAVG